MHGANDNEKLEYQKQLANLGEKKAKFAKEEAEAAGEFITAKKEEAMKLQEIVDLSNKLLELQEDRLLAERKSGEAKTKALDQIEKQERNIENELAKQTGSRKEAQEILVTTRGLNKEQIK